jgi:cytidylate kinase
MQKVIAIDGPSGSGKSTLAKNLADSLNVLYIDTGAMYRGLALDAHQKNIPYEEGTALDEYLKGIDLVYGESSEKLIQIDKKDLTEKIREHHVSGLASQFSQIVPVREFLLNFQRKLGEEKICVMEGRDITTVVFPDAFCKVFITASPEVRAERRWNQLKETKGDDTPSLEQILKDVLDRDHLDTNRSVSPLKVAEDAILMDTSKMNPEEVLKELVAIAKKKANENGLAL